MDLYEIGIVLTLFLVAINGFLIVADTLPGMGNLLTPSEGSFLSGFTITEYDLNQVNPATTEFGGATLSSIVLVGTPLAFFNAGVSAVLIVGKFLFQMVFGYVFIIDRITNEIEMGLIGAVLIAILMFIELYMLYMLLMRAISVIRGGGA